MITIITHIASEENKVRITSNVVSTVNGVSSAAGASSLRDFNENIKDEIMRTASSAMFQIQHSISNSFDLGVIDKCKDLTPASAIEEKNAEIANLKGQLAQKDNDILALNRSIDAIRAEYFKYKEDVIAAAKMLSGNGAPAGIPVAETSLGLEHALVSESIPVTAQRRVVVLNAAILNRAILDKESLESRQCSRCNNAIIAPLSLHDADVVCTRCQPQRAEDIQPLTGSAPQPFLNPFATSNSDDDNYDDNDEDSYDNDEDYDDEDTEDSPF